MMFRKEYEKWLRRRRSRAIERFRKRLEGAYPDGARFLSALKEVDCGNTKLPVFILNANLAGRGFISARGICAREAIAQEILNALEERSHAIDISRVRINSCHEAEDFVLELRFDYDSSFKQS